MWYDEGVRNKAFQASFANLYHFIIMKKKKEVKKNGNSYHDNGNEKKAFFLIFFIYGINHYHTFPLPQTCIEANGLKPFYGNNYFS